MKVLKSIYWGEGIGRGKKETPHFKHTEQERLKIFHAEMEQDLEGLNPPKDHSTSLALHWNMLEEKGHIWYQGIAEGKGTIGPVRTSDRSH